jgi:hypothetical protein
MAFELKENQITIFKNSKKEAGTKQPDYTGKLKINGELKDVSLWIMESEKGTKWFNGSIKEEYKKDANKEPERIVSENENSDDLPF